MIKSLRLKQQLTAKTADELRPTLKLQLSRANINVQLQQRELQQTLAFNQKYYTFTNNVLKNKHLNKSPFC